jgi:hypothetical protein
MVSFNVDYWEVVEYGVDEFGCEYSAVIQKNMPDLEAKRYAGDLRYGREEHEQNYHYIARKMG